MKNKHIGSSFDDFLREEGILEEVKDKAKKKLSRQRLWQIKQEKKGRCRICGNMAEEGKKLCKFHLEKQEYYNNQRKLKRIENGTL